MPVRFMVRSTGIGVALRALSDLESKAALAPKEMVKRTAQIAEEETNRKLKEVSGFSTMFTREVMAREKRRGKWTKPEFSGGGSLCRANVVLDFTTHPVLKYYVEGTRPHIIRARHADALSFIWMKLSGLVFFKSVHHPGTKPHDIMTDIRASTRKRVDSELINWFRGRG
jgi:hypothetical protein